MHTEAYDAAFNRIKSATGARTQGEVAGIVGVTQASVSDSRSRGSVPDSWLLALLEKYQLNPAWVVHGAGPKFMAPVDDLSAPAPAPEPSFFDRLSELFCESAANGFDLRIAIKRIESNAA